MSTFSIPDSFMSHMDQLKKMNEDASALMPRELAGAVNLMAHPLAGAAAFSALGFGAASHAFGIWLGAAETWQRMLTPMLDDLAPSTADFEEKRKPPVARARAATDALIAEARVAVKQTVRKAAGETVARPVETVVEEAPAALPAVVAPAKALMPEDFSKPAAMDKPEAPDDLKLISGIGPKLEQVLNGLGVWTYAQIAGWSSQEIAWVDDYLGFKGRIGRDGWIEQAKTLADGTKPGTGQGH